MNRVSDHAARYGLRFRCYLLVLGCSAVLAACGGDGQRGSSGPHKPSARATSPSGGASDRTWAARVNAVCRENQQAVRRTVAEVRAEGLGQRETTAEVLERSVPIERRLLRRLGEVPAPEALQGEFDRFVGRLRATLPLLQDLAAAVRASRNDPELTTKLTRIAADTRPFATEHELRACLPDAG